MGACRCWQFQEVTHSLLPVWVLVLPWDCKGSMCLESCHGHMQNAGY